MLMDEYNFILQTGGKSLAQERDVSEMFPHQNIACHRDEGRSPRDICSDNPVLRCHSCDSEHKSAHIRLCLHCRDLALGTKQTIPSKWKTRVHGYIYIVLEQEIVENSKLDKDHSEIWLTEGGGGLTMWLFQLMYY